MSSTPTWRPHARPLVWSSSPSRQTLLAGLFGVALLARLAVLAAGHASIESWEYETLAQNIISGKGYVIMHFGHVSFAFGDGNLYSFLAGAVYLALGHRLLALALVQAIIGSLVGPLLFAVGERPLGARVAALGGLLGALHPGLLAYTLKLHPLGLDVVLMAALVYWMQRGGRQPGLLNGLALGLNLMSRPTFFAAGVVAMALRWRRREIATRPVLLALALGVAIALPWVARNWAVLGRPVFMSTSLEEAWKGNNPAASGSGMLRNGQDAFSELPPAMKQRISTLTEPELNDYFGQAVMEFARTQPLAFARLVAHKFAYFWWSSPQMGMLYPSAWLRAYLAYAGIVLFFAGVGSVSIVRGQKAEARALLLTIVSISLTIATIHALTYVEGRHRWGIEPLLLLLSARGMVVAASSIARAATGDGEHRQGEKAQ